MRSDFSEAYWREAEAQRARKAVGWDRLQALKSRLLATALVRGWSIHSGEEKGICLKFQLRKDRVALQYEFWNSNDESSVQARYVGNGDFSGPESRRWQVYTDREQSANDATTCALRELSEKMRVAAQRQVDAANATRALISSFDRLT